MNNQPTYAPLTKIEIPVNGKLSIEQSREFLKSLKTGNARSGKYNAIPKVADGIRFDSTKEADRYMDLKMMENAGEITGLQRQVKFKLIGCYYKLDFMYFDYRSKQMIYEDCKGMRTPVYRLKKKQMQELYQITITES